MSTERSSTGLDGLFRELRSLIDRLGTESDVADINKTSRFGSKDGVDGIASVQVRTIIGGSDVPDSASAAVPDVQDASAQNDKAEHNEPVQPTREPNVEILDESGRIILIAEMPGVSEAAVSCIVDGDTVRLEGIGPRDRYLAVRRLPRSMADAKVEIRARHGVVEVTIARNGA